MENRTPSFDRRSGAVRLLIRVKKEEFLVPEHPCKLEDKTTSAINFEVSVYDLADPSGRAVCVGLRPSACWDCGFESHRGHGYLSLVSVRVVR
jgi:hypothetical protein